MARKYPTEKCVRCKKTTRCKACGECGPCIVEEKIFMAEDATRAAIELIAAKLGPRALHFVHDALVKASQSEGTDT